MTYNGFPKCTRKNQNSRTFGAQNIILTFKVNLPISIEVKIPEDLINLSVVELLSHQLLHSFSQFSKTDLTITIRVKLRLKDQLKGA